MTSRRAFLAMIGLAPVAAIAPAKSAPRAIPIVYGGNEFAAKTIWYHNFRAPNLESGGEFAKWVKGNPGTMLKALGGPVEPV